MKTLKINLPAQWASAIINCDYSGLTGSEIKELNNTLINEGLSFCDCFDCGEYFIGKFNGLICELSTYTFKMKG